MLKPQKLLHGWRLFIDLWPRLWMKGNSAGYTGFTYWEVHLLYRTIDWNWAGWPWMELPVDYTPPPPPHPWYHLSISSFAHSYFHKDTHCLMIEGHTHTHTFVFRWQYVVYFLYFKGLLFTNKITKKKSKRFFDKHCLSAYCCKKVYIYLSFLCIK